MPGKKRISDLRAGLIGSGFIGPVHIEALSRLGVRVTAICGSEKARAVAERWSIPRVFPRYDYRRLVESDAVDVVHITSPNRFHHEQCLAAIRAGKHVVCEKPLAMTARETAELARLAAGSPRIFAVNYNVRFYPAVLQLRSSILRGDLGEVIHVNGSYLQDWLLKETDYSWRILEEEGGRLRAVADIGTHWMDTASFVLGSRIDSVLAHLGTFHERRKRPAGEVRTFARASKGQRFLSYPVKTEDYASILLRFANGAHGNLGVSQVAAGRKNCIRIEVYGSKRSAWWDSEEPNTLHHGSRDGPNETSPRATPGFLEDVARYTDYPAGHAEGFPDSFKMLYRAVYEAIAQGKPRRPLYAMAEDGHHEVKVCEAILKSHGKKGWVNV